MGFCLRKKGTGHAGGRAALCWARIWLCWVRWASLSADLALLGAAWGLGVLGVGVLLWARLWLSVSWVGRGFGSARRAGLGWAWGLASGGRARI